MMTGFKDLSFEECRIKGVTLVKPKDGGYRFDYATAASVCEQLGFILANKSHIEEANTHGFETCSFGWVADGFGVISRIHANEKCGQSKIGAVMWSVSLSKAFNAYCFNASDIWINSCIPDVITTTLQGTTGLSSVFDSATEAATSTSIWKTSAGPKPSTQNEKETYTSIPSITRIPANVKTAVTKPTTPSSFSESLTTVEVMEETTATPIKGTFKSKQVIFGGLPTALLVLALIFFAAAVALAVCYVKKYKANLQIISKPKNEENVEVKVLKETENNHKNDENAQVNVVKETKNNVKSSNGEQKQNGKPTENNEAKPTAAEKSVEAEV
ncbi:lymphatic vessel endothelial hyaluronic acid receptor 1 isoform X2 [Lissotriton helveticus]